MVKLHQPATPRALVVKRPRRSSVLTRTPTCLWPGCGATLASHHEEPVCSCHVPAGYNPRHDPQLAVKIRHLVIAAYPSAVDLCAVLKCVTHDIDPTVRWLNRRRDWLGGTIRGARRGYVWVPCEFGDRARTPRGRLGS